jgi:hypothetical protein
MLAAASLIPDGIKHDESVLRLHPDPAGVQHDEQKGGFLKFGLREIKNDKAVMHKSVYRRFAAGPVVLFDRMGVAYRPMPMKSHVDFVQYFDPDIADPKPADPETSQVADDIEYKWEHRCGVESGTVAPTHPVADVKTSDGEHNADPV